MNIDENFDEDNDGAYCLDPSEGLSELTYAALLQFLPTRSFVEDIENEYDKGIDDSTVCIAYTEKDMNMISSTFKRLDEANLSSRTNIQEVAQEATVLQNLEATRENYHQELVEEGMIRLDNILSADICDRVLISVNNSLAKEIAEGNVKI